MTREEAIAYGNRVINLGLNDETQAFCEMAIKALEQEPKADLKPLFCEECGITDMQPLYMQRFCRFCGAKMESEVEE